MLHTRKFQLTLRRLAREYELDAFHFIGLKDGDVVDSVCVTCIPTDSGDVQNAWDIHLLKAAVDVLEEQGHLSVAEHLQLFINLPAARYTKDWWKDVYTAWGVKGIIALAYATVAPLVEVKAILEIAGDPGTGKSTLADFIERLEFKTEIDLPIVDFGDKVKMVFASKGVDRQSKLICQLYLSHEYLSSEKREAARKLDAMTALSLSNYRIA